MKKPIKGSKGKGELDKEKFIMNAYKVAKRFLSKWGREVIYMPKVTIKGKIKHFPYTKAGIMAAKKAMKKKK